MVQDIRTSQFNYLKNLACCLSFCLTVYLLEKTVKKMKNYKNNRLEKIVAESIRKVLNESSDESVSLAIDKCINIILKTENASRGFDFKGSELEQDPNFKELKERLIFAMKSYFESAKEMLSYLAEVSTDEYSRSNASKYLQREFKSGW